MSKLSLYTCDQSPTDQLGLLQNSSSGSMLYEAALKHRQRAYQQFVCCLLNLILSGRAGASTSAQLILITPKQFLPCASQPHGNIFVLHNSRCEVCKVSGRPHPSLRMCGCRSLMSACVRALQNMVHMCAQKCACICLCHRCQPTYRFHDFVACPGMHVERKEKKILCRLGM